VSDTQLSLPLHHEWAGDTHPMGVPLLASLDSFDMALEYVSSIVALGGRTGRSWAPRERLWAGAQFPQVTHLSRSSKRGVFCGVRVGTPRLLHGEPDGVGIPQCPGNLILQNPGDNC
jgi:hypothetical protein